MNTFLISCCSAILIFAGVLVSLAFGRRIGRHHLFRFGDDATTGFGSLEAAVFGLMGLLIAFTFTGAANRFDERRDLITQQVNAIGTAWLRLDLLSEPDRIFLQDRLRTYVELQIDIGRNSHDPQALNLSLQGLNTTQQEIWSKLIDAVKNDRSIPIAQTLLPPVNDVFDLSSTRLLTSRRHPPAAVYVLLFVLAILSSLMAGFSMAKAKSQSPLHAYGFAAILAISVYLILDMEHPRLGLIRVDSFDQAFVELLDSMK